VLDSVKRMGKNTPNCWLGRWQKLKSQDMGLGVM
jgi:hypothetical protein